MPADAPLKNAQGKLTYFGGDVTYHKDKLSRSFDHMVTIWGADHGGHVGRLQAAVEALSGHKSRLKVVLCQMVRVLQGGKPLKMSKRAGQMIALEELCQAVGPDVLRFMLLTQSQGTHLTLDIEDMLKTSNENPVFYVLYAYARAHSVMRAAGALWNAADVDDAHLLEVETVSLLKGKTLEIVRHLAFWPACVEGAARAAEPHRLTTYLIELARLFHSLWSSGKKDTTLRFLHEDDKAVSMRWLAILRAMMTVIAHGCAILGIEPREQMFS
jgi:arginyl-tRNA synthetase